jgi:hypothetical protein
MPTIKEVYAEIGIYRAHFANILVLKENVLQQVGRRVETSPESCHQRANC